MNGTRSAPVAPLTEARFVQVLEQLVVTRDAEGAVSVGPCDTPERDLVAAYVVDLIEANPATGDYLLTRLRRRPRDRAGVRRLPVGELADALDLTARHGVPA